jgi:hypothetical protein
VDVSKDLIKYYFDHFISDYLDEHQDVPNDVSELDEYLPNLKSLLMKNHEQIRFALGIKTIINNPETDFQCFYGYNFPLESEEIRDIMIHLLRLVSPKKILKDISVRITNESLEESRINNGLLYKVECNESLKDISDIKGISLDLIKKANPYWVEMLGCHKPIEKGKLVKLTQADVWH